MRLGIITGSGTYALPGFSGARPRVQETRFGSVTLTEGRFADVEVVHLSRHGVGHVRLSNHVEHRANVLALHACGVDAVLAVTVCGAVDPKLALSSLVVFDDLHFAANRLPDGSLCTVHDQAGAAGRGHWVFERPFSEPLRRALLNGARSTGLPLADGGCYGHVDGPRFNSRAEIRMLAACGVSAVSQTAGPETVLCGELDLPYALLGYVTDYANGVSAQPTPLAELMRLVKASADALAGTLAAAVSELDADQLGPVGSHFRFD